MAITQFATDNVNAVKEWEQDTVKEMDMSMPLRKYIGTDDTAMIQEVEELQKGAGDACTVPFLFNLRGEGVTGDVSVVDKLESQQYRADVLYINETRHGISVPNKGSIGQKRVAFNCMENGRRQIITWGNQIRNISLMSQLCGYNGQDYYIDGVTKPLYQHSGNYTGNNPVIPPDGKKGRWFTPEGLTEDKLTAKHGFTSLRIIDNLVKRAELMNPPIRPISGLGYEEADFVLFLHPTQATDLRTNTERGQWMDLTKYAYMGAKDDQGGIKDGFLGVYNRTLIIVNRYVTRGVDPATGRSLPNVKRAVFCGAKALLFARGTVEDNSERKPFKVFIGFEDADKWVVLVPSMIWGMKKTIFNREGKVGNIVDSAGEYATITYSSYGNDQTSTDPTLFAPVGSASSQAATMQAAASLRKAKDRLDAAETAGEKQAAQKALNTAREAMAAAQEKADSRQDADNAGKEQQTAAGEFQAANNGNAPQGGLTEGE